MMRPLHIIAAAAAVAGLSAVSAATGSDAGIKGIVQAYRSSYVNACVISTVEEIAVEEGQPVQAGAVLCQLACEPQRKNLDLAKLKAENKTALSKAEVARDQAKLDLDRNEGLFKKGTIGLASIQEQRNTYKVAVINVEAWQAELKRLAAEAACQEAGLEQYTLRAPFSGEVAEKLIELGETTYPLDKRLFLIIDTSKVYVEVHPDIALLKEISVGEEVILETDLYPDRKFPATIALIASTADAGSGGRSFKFKALAENTDGLLLPEMQVTVTLAPADKSTEGDDAQALPAVQDAEQGATAEASTER